MKRLAGCASLILGFALVVANGQALSASALASPAKPPRHAKNRETKGGGASKGDEKDPLRAAVGENSVPKGEPIITEIYADEAFFDSANHIGIFTGHVIVNDPRFNVQSDKLTIYLSKNATGAEAQNAPPEKAITGPNQSLEKAVAEGNVGVVRDRPGENGEPPTRSVGRGEMAIYTTSDGKVELRGTPRVQSGLNTHIATSPDTVMVLEQDGQLTTKGPSRTEIRQPPKSEQSPGASPAASVAPAKR